MSMSRRNLLLNTAALASTGGNSLLGARAFAATNGWVAPPKQPVRVIENEWITLRDGTRLSCRLWIPESAMGEPAPVVWSYMPYRLRDGTRAGDDIEGRALAEHGIAYARVDVRGSGDSEGVLIDEYAPPELDDGVEVIGWLARQPWSNGSVGMTGLSWAGINTLQIAAMAPPALKAIMPMGCCDNRFTGDAHYVGGALSIINFQWGTNFKGVMAGPPDPAIVGPDWEKMWRQRLDATPAILAKWVSHQSYDDYWRRGSIVENYGAIKCPVYVVSGWLDPYSQVVGRMLANLKTPRKGLIGPWGHINPGSAAPLGLDWTYEAVRWWMQWLKGVDTGIMDEPMLRVYMPYRTMSEVAPGEIPGRWVAEQAWPSARSRQSVWHLNAGGQLSAAPGAPSSVDYVADKIVGLTKPQWMLRRPDDQTADDKKSLCFDSALLDEDMEILGYPVARVRVAADVPVAKLVVRVTEVLPDGKSWLVTYGLLNLTHRKSHEHLEPLTPGEFYDVEVPLFLVAHRFKQGSRIRVAISESLWPLVWPSPRIARLTIGLGASTLTLPMRPPPRIEAPFPIPQRHSSQAFYAPPATPAEDDGRVTFNFDAPSRSSVIPDIGTTRIGGATESVAMKEGEPNSCVWRVENTGGWKRGDWDCTIIATFEMTSTESAFQLKESLSAKKDDVEFFHNEKTSTIPRNLM